MVTECPHEDPEPACADCLRERIVALEAENAVLKLAMSGGTTREVEGATREERQRLMGQAIAEYEAEHGVITKEQMTEAWGKIIAAGITKTFREALDRTMKNHAGTFKKLAE